MILRRSILKMAATARSTSADTRILEPNFFRGNTYETRARDATPQVRITDAVKHEHGELRSFADRILNSTNPDEQTRFQNQFTWELARHYVGEELVVYPALERHVEGGKDLADKDRREHQGIREHLQEFQDLNSTDPRFIPSLQRLMEDLRQHMDQENAHLVKLDEALSKDDSVGLTQRFDRTKAFVPTRAHPMTPQNLPFETAMGLMTAPIDYLSDMFRKWPSERPS